MTERCRLFRKAGIVVQAHATENKNRLEQWDKALHCEINSVRTNAPVEFLTHQLWKTVKKRPALWTLHRGAARYAPENTIGAYQEAVRLDADFVEFDVRTSKDGQLFLMHDRQVDRTTDGHGAIDQLSSDEITRLDAGSWFGRAWIKTPVPTFDQLLDAVGGRIGLYVDAKNVDPKLLVEKLNQHRLLETSIVYGNPIFLARIKKIEPRLRLLAPLVDKRLFSFYTATLKPYAVDTSWDDLSEQLINQCHAKNVKVFSDAPSNATVEDYCRVINWKIDQIQTDEPTRLMRAIEVLEAKEPEKP